jgi:hypothetical protein
MAGRIVATPLRAIMRQFRSATSPAPPPALVKQARHEYQRPEPQRPGDHRAMSRGELYRYYERQGLLAVFFALYPGG